MAYIGDTCVYIGSPDWHVGDPLAFIPDADFGPNIAEFSVNGVARLDANTSVTTDPLGDVLFFSWSLRRKPPKSVGKFTLRDDSRVALLNFDDVGVYAVELVVSGANGGCSTTSKGMYVCVPFAAPFQSQQVYDTSWIWQLLPDFWSLLEQTDKSKIEVFWRGLQQLVGSDLQHLYNTKNDGSIATIQDKVIRRWSKLQLSQDISDARFLLDETRIVASSVLDMRLTHSRQDDFELSSTPGQIIEPRLFLLETHTASSFDAAKKAIIVYALDGREIEVTIGGPVRVGERVAFSTLQDMELPVGKDYPIPCNVSLKRGDFREFGSVGLDNGQAVSVELYQPPNVYSMSSAYVKSGEYDAVTGTQISLAGLERLGVRAEDVVSFYVESLDYTKRKKLYADVVAVADDYAVLSFRYADLEEMLDDLLALFEPSSDEIELVRDELLVALRSRDFKARYHTQWMTALDTIRVGQDNAARSYRIVPDFVYRRSLAPANNNLLHLIRLTEFVERTLVEDGKVLTESGDDINLGRSPIELFENLDFYIRKSEDVGVGLKTVADNKLNEFTSARFNFEIAAVEVGDTLVIENKQGVGTYTIEEVLNTQTIRVTSAARAPFYNARFRVYDGRQRPSDYVVINSGLLPEDSPLDYLWAESSVVSNHESVEVNFGHLAKFPYEEWYARALTNTYRASVIGVLLARMTSPTIQRIQDTASLISGVPFAETNAIIREIDETYEVDEVTGEATVSRVLLEEIVDGVPVQRFSSHTFPALTTNRLAEFAGLSLNPNTGKRFVVGDTIEQFKTLALGCKISDIYDQSPFARLDDVKDRHRFRVTIDVDSTRLKESTLILVQDFVLDIRPAYTAFALSLLKFVVDLIEIESEVNFRIGTRLFDNPYFHRGPANIFEEYGPEYSENDDAPFVVLSTWFPKDGVFSTGAGGELYLTSALGGFVDPSALGTYRGPWIRDEDALFGQADMVLVRSAGYPQPFPIKKIISNTQLELSLSFQRDDGSFNVVPFPGLQDNVSFVVVRRRRETIAELLVSLNADSTIQIESIGDSAADTAIGDKIYFDQTGVAPSLIIDQQEPLGASPYYRLLPPPPVGLENNTDAIVRHGEVADKFRYEDAVIARGRYFEIPQNNSFYEGIEIGDRVIVLLESEVQEHRVCAATDTNLVYVYPELQAADGASIKIRVERPNKTQAGDEIDEHERAIETACSIAIKGIEASLLEPADSPNIAILKITTPDIAQYVQAGDIFVEAPRTGSIAASTGEGPGTLRVIDSVSDTEVLIAADLDTSFLNLSLVWIRQARPYTVYFSSQSEEDRWLNPLLPHAGEG